MSVILTDGELALCIASLEYAAGELRGGVDASKRLNMPIPPGLVDMANEMDALRTKLLGGEFDNGNQVGDNNAGS